MRARIIVAICVPFVLLAAGFVLWQPEGEANNAAAQVPSTPAEVASAPARPVPAGLKRYHNDVLNFSVDYPEELPASEQRSGSALTVSFQRETGEPGFQIFVVPYAGAQITKERFLDDVPTGVMRDQVDAIVDGARGVAFYSTNLLVGDTYEIWFIHGGYLYEVTTYKELDTWLQGIMGTWKFE